MEGQKKNMEYGRVKYVKVVLSIYLVCSIIILSSYGCGKHSKNKNIPRIGSVKKQEIAKKRLSELGLPFDEKGFRASLEHVRPVIVSLYLDAGMNPNIKVEYPYGGNTQVEKVPLIYFLLEYYRRNEPVNPEVVRLLLSYGAEVNVKDHNGYTPLLLAAETGNAAVVKLLLDAGADVTAKNNFGQTALSLAKMVVGSPLKRYFEGYSFLKDANYDEVILLLWEARATE